LDPDTCYDFYLRADCTGTSEGFSYWTFPQTGTTQVAPPVCGGQYIDNGGVDGPYLPGTNSIVTICPAVGEIVVVTFTAFNTETNWDGLYVYDGGSTSSPLISSGNNPGNGNLTQPGAWWGSTIPGPFESTSPDGCLTFQFISDTSVQFDGFVADVTCIPAPTCPKPTAVQVGIPTNDSVDVSWTAVGPATQWTVYAIPCDDPAPVGGQPGGTTVTVPSATVEGLTESTCYSIYVIANCSETDFSNPTMPQDITTQVDPPVCGGIFYDDGGPNANYSPDSDSIVTICAENPGDAVQVVFTAFNTLANWDGFYVYDGDDTSAPPILSNNGPGFSNDLQAPGAFWGSTIPGPFESSNPEGCLTFHFYSENFGNNPGWEANVNCYPVTCPKPFGVTVLNTTVSSVEVDWTPVGPATTWEVLVLPASAPFPDASATGWQSTTAHPFTFQPLNSGTLYNVYVRSVCSDSDKSSWTYPTGFVTPITNDDCSGATVVPVNQSPVCVEFVSGTMIGATDSGVVNTCFGSSDDDVWFQFVATNPDHAISFLNINEDFPSLTFAIFTNGCEALELVECVDASEALINGLVPGQTYFIQAYSTFTPQNPYTFDLCITTLLPPIATSEMNTTYTPEQLIQDILIGGDCAVASNITTSTGTDFSSVNGIGYFEKNGSSFQFEEGIILSTGDVNLAPGPNLTTQGAGGFPAEWPGDTDLEAIILAATGEAMNSNNASIIEFDFVPITPQISFDFIFASE
ncbi:MAG: adhesin, partial [Sphingobacteriales bacterium]